MNSWLLIAPFGLVLALSLGFFAAAKWSMVEVWAAHAARANKHVETSSVRFGRIPLFGRVRTTDGAYLDTTDTVVVTAIGNSLGHIGIPDGSRLVARKIEGQPDLEPGDLVIINAQARGSNVTRRLRVVDEVMGDEVTFKADPDGRPHKMRRLQSVEAKVTHLLT